MQTFITIIHILTAVFMILVVLVQGGNSGGVGAAFGGGNSTGFFGASGATSFLGKLTYGAAAVFMITSISLSVYAGNAGSTGLRERLQKEATKTEATAPAAAPTATTTKPETVPAPAPKAETTPAPAAKTQASPTTAPQTPAPQK